MKKKIFLLKNKLGIDGAIAFTVLSRIIQAGGGVITLLFVAKFLSKVEQGYYYTFGSILAIQIFFELGLSNIITQFVAYEVANLKWEDKVSFSGPIEASSRLSSLLRFTIRWFAVIAILLFIGLLITGYCFFYKFGKNDTVVEWQIPWVILSVTTSLSLMISPILAFLEGLGKIKEVAKIRLIQQVVQLLLILSLFFIGFKLFSSPLAAIIAFLLVPIWILFSEKKKMLVFIWNKIDVYKVNYRLEIFPFQWKIALSWISGYFIFQLFNPVLFATEGPIVAGQMGMTLAVLNSILMFTLSWVSTKVPIFSSLISKMNYKELDSLFNKTLIQSSFLNFVALTFFFMIIFIFRHFDIKIQGENIADRFLPFFPMLFMTIPIFLNHVINAWATYLRCHKKEPMLILSIVIGILCSISTIVLGKKFGSFGMTLGYMILTILSFIWTYLIFKNKKTAWHAVIKEI
ncbi:polysaccharide biosynthesis protein [Flavobacterium sp. KACC 22761]|uniref:lipopolysaccharide biosynthesis protein n=1 Tax=Flavobacterium sp. KACC 22761 TaxID=3092665 RepID=UPI002A75EA43|nr:polysaccharide biosynthesis protein [Flavobacterium sp. KACC 22761]WPO79526.1 polysaccharide biosynthesis protein [Flavobacterium sp. KACC 22761]